MAAAKTRSSSFSRNFSAVPTSQIPGLKYGPNGTIFVSSGILDLDSGFPLGSLVMVMEDPQAPHHMLLLRNFMSQGLIHYQHLLYASPAREPRAFLGTLPSPILSKDDKLRNQEIEQEKGLRIAWQYKKYFGEHQQNFEVQRDGKPEYCNDFDLRKPLERHFLSGQHIECVSLLGSQDLVSLHDRCSTFLAQLPRSLKSAVRSSNAVAVITFPASLVSSSFSKRCQHLADTLLSVRAIPDEDEELADLLTGYQDMVGLLNVHKVARLNTQVPFIVEATTFSVKLKKRRSLVLECLNQAPIDSSSGSSYATSGSCSGLSKTGRLDF